MGLAIAHAFSERGAVLGLFSALVRAGTADGADAGVGVSDAGPVEPEVSCEWIQEKTPPGIGRRFSFGEGEETAKTRRARRGREEESDHGRPGGRSGYTAEAQRARRG